MIKSDKSDQQEEMCQIRTIGNNTVDIRVNAENVIGSGNIGKVFIGLKKVEGSNVKQLTANKVLNRYDKSNNLLEHVNLTNIEHTNINQTFYTHNSELQLLVSEYQPLQLETYLSTSNCFLNDFLSESEIKRMAGQIIQALQFLYNTKACASNSNPTLYNQCFEHCNIKNSNCLLTNNYQIKINDFNFSLILAVLQDRLNRQQQGDNSNLRPIGDYFNSNKQYMSLEIAEDAPQKDHILKVADMWAFGVLLFEMCYRRHVFDFKGQIPRSQLISTIKYRMKKDETNVQRLVSKEIKDIIQGIFLSNINERTTLKELFVKEWVQKANSSEQLNQLRYRVTLDYNVNAQSYKTHPICNINAPLEPIKKSSKDLEQINGIINKKIKKLSALMQSLAHLDVLRNKSLLYSKMIKMIFDKISLFQEKEISRICLVLAKMQFLQTFSIYCLVLEGECDNYNKIILSSKKEGLQHIKKYSKFNTSQQMLENTDHFNVYAQMHVNKLRNYDMLVKPIGLERLSTNDLENKTTKPAMKKPFERPNELDTFYQFLIKGKNQSTRKLLRRILKNDLKGAEEQLKLASDKFFACCVDNEDEAAEKQSENDRNFKDLILHSTMVQTEEELQSMLQYAISSMFMNQAQSLQESLKQSGLRVARQYAFFEQHMRNYAQSKPPQDDNANKKESQHVESLRNNQEFSDQEGVKEDDRYKIAVLYLLGLVFGQSENSLFAVSNYLRLEEEVNIFANIEDPNTKTPIKRALDDEINERICWVAKVHKFVNDDEMKKLYKRIVANFKNMANFV